MLDVFVKVVEIGPSKIPTYIPTYKYFWCSTKSSDHHHIWLLNFHLLLEDKSEVSVNVASKAALSLLSRLWKRADQEVVDLALVFVSLSYLLLT